MCIRDSIYTDGCVLISSNYSSGSAAIICSSHSVEAPQVLIRLRSSSTDQVTPLVAEVAAISLAICPGSKIKTVKWTILRHSLWQQVSSWICQQGTLINPRTKSGYQQRAQVLIWTSGQRSQWITWERSCTSSSLQRSQGPEDIMWPSNTLSIINSTIHDPPLQHTRTASVYSHATLHAECWHLSFNKARSSTVGTAQKWPLS